ncbi:MAG: methyltransferase domain-containing protein [Acidiferrobacter sp.]
MGESTDEGATDRTDLLRVWFEGALGESLHALEAHRLREILPALPGTFAVQLGWFGRRDLLESSPTAVHLLVDSQGAPKGPQLVQALPEALPLDSKSVQVVLLPHTLDVSCTPHQLLREAHRVLVPEGHVVIVGFNAMSLWGLSCFLHQRRTRPPWCGEWIGARRLKDWLSLLDFELTHGSMLYYRPPFKRQTLMDRLFFLERIGDRWWPLAAAVYVVVAKKRNPGLTPIVPALRRSRVRALVQPAGARYG